MLTKINENQKRTNKPLLRPIDAFLYLKSVPHFFLWSYLLKPYIFPLII